MTIIKYRHYSHQNSIQFFLVMVICSVRNQSIKLVHWKKQWTIITCFQTHLLDTCNKGYKRPLIFTPLLLMVRCDACKWLCDFVCIKTIDKDKHDTSITFRDNFKTHSLVLPRRPIQWPDSSILSLLLLSKQNITYFNETK